MYHASRESALPNETSGVIGTGGIYASAEDLALFGSIFYPDSVLSQKLVQATMVEEYRAGLWPEDEDQTLSFGLGGDNVELLPFEKAGLYGAMGQTFEISISESGELTIPALLADMPLRYHSDGSYRDENGYLLFKLIKEKDGNTYLFQKSYAAFPGLPPIATSLYTAQQLPVRDVDPELWDSWEAYNNHTFFLLSEPPTSELYLLSALSPFPVVKNDYGYINGLSIIDKTTLMPVLTIPGVGSRDYQPITLMQENEKTYMRAGDYVLLLI